MSEMIERVARAIALAALDDETRSVVDPENWPVAESYCDMARAAIEAMREPTEAMIDAGVNAKRQNVDVYFDGATVPRKNVERVIYKDMIDAALSEKP